MFQLSPNNRDQSDEVLLADLHAVAGSLGKPTLTRDDYGALGRFSPATIANRFGGWGRALERAGIRSARHFDVSREQTLADLQRVATELGSTTITVATYLAHGRYSEKPVIRHFGSWPKALEAAGLNVSDAYKPRLLDEALFENLEAVWRRLGRQPTVNDMHRPLSAHSAHTYKRRFGGWRKALEKFVAATATDKQSEQGPATPSVQQGVALATVEEPILGKVRGVGWRLRYLVLKRDRFACRACGRSPASHPGVELQVDHIVAWSNGGLTVEGNLQTLCAQCNVGKGAV